MPIRPPEPPVPPSQVPPSPAPGATPPAAAPSLALRLAQRRPPRWLPYFMVVMLVLPLLMAAVVVSAVKTQSGTRTLWKLATEALPGKLSGEIVGGTLADGLSLRHLSYQDALRTVRIDQVSGAWHLSLSPLALSIASLRIGQADVTLRPSPPTPLTLPKEIKLPLALDLRNLRIERVVLHNAGSTSQYSAIRASAASDRIHHRVQLENAVTPFGTVHAALRLDGTAPFALDGTAGLASVFQQQTYNVDATLAGTLEALGVKLRAGGGKLDGSADIDATPFAPVPFRQARIAVHHLDPRVFNAAAPQADLAVEATLAPVADGSAALSTPGIANAPRDLSLLAVTGPLAITNATPGPIDKGLLPLVSAQAAALLTAQRQELRQIRIALPGAALITGGAVLADTGKGALTLDVSALDLHAVLTSLANTRLAGPVRVGLDKGTQDISAQLASPALALAAEAHLDAGHVNLKSARLQAGASQLTLSGTLGRDEQSAFAIKGALKDFDPATVLAQVRPSGNAAADSGRPAGSDAKPVSPKSTRPVTAKSTRSAKAVVRASAGAVAARINMDFDADGALKPELAAKLHLAIHDSTYGNLPMTGGGVLAVAGQRLLSSDLNVSVAGNTVAVKGSFGAPADRLDFNIDAPALERLGYGLAGRLQASGRLAGTLTHPVIDARYAARSLALAGNRVAQLDGEAHVDGVPGNNPNARLVVSADAVGVHGGPADLEQLHLHLNGTYAAHTIALKADGKLNGQPLLLSIAAQGKLEQRGQAYAWDGVLKTLDNRGVPKVSIGAPLQLSVAPGAISLGATRLTLGPAVIDLKGLEYRPGLIRSQGAFNALQLADVLELQHKLGGPPPPVKTTLAFDGAWDLTLADTARGYVQLTRRSGDITAATPNGASTLGLTVLSLRADGRGDHLQVESRIQASRVGNLAAHASIGLIHQDGRVSVGAGSSLAGTLEGALPNLRTLGALSGPAVALDGNIQINLAASGSVGKPKFSGTLNGDKLALTLYDQGVRLRDGVARIVLDNNFVDLREVLFHGGSGTLRATGRIPLDQSGTGLTATISADKLQLLSDPAKQLTLSGKASMANVNQRLQVNGKFTVDRALFSLPDKTAPKLGDDVVIVHKGAAPKRPVQDRARDAAPSTAPPGLLPPEINVTVDLGDSFRFKGAGADILLAGAIDVRSGPKLAPQASGTVRIASGKYEAFGAKLDIERGLITFQGPFDNPSINILAMRRNQEVPAGVQVTGTVQQPRVALVSEPNLADEEKLSWLVFGHAGTGSSASTGQAQAAVQSAALGLLNKTGGDPLAKHLGLDKLSIGASEYGTSTKQVVNLGKEISERLNIGYEQGLAGASSVLKLTYVLSQHWSVVARGGAVSGLDLLYSRRFDKLRGGADSITRKVEAQTP